MDAPAHRHPPATRPAQRLAAHLTQHPSCAVLQVATAIRGAIIQAKMSVVPVRRGYWGNKIGKVHTVPIKVTGKCGSVSIRLVPAPRGAGIVAARVPKKVRQPSQCTGVAVLEDLWVHLYILSCVWALQLRALALDGMSACNIDAARANSASRGACGASCSCRLQLRQQQ